MNFLKKSSLWKFVIAVFTLSLYAHIAEAKGQGWANFWGIFVSVVLMVVAIILVPFTAGMSLVWFSYYAVLQLTAVAIGQVTCLAGTDNIFFRGCGDKAGNGGNPQQAGAPVPGSPILNNESYTATCNSVSLTYDISGANGYGIYRDGTLLKNASAQGLSKITYTDSGLASQKTYNYILVMTDMAYKQYQYPVMNAYTKCLPSCTFGADKSQVVFPATLTLSWSCQGADSCSIAPGVGSVSVPSGSTVVSPTSTTNYVLTCSNIDGSASFPASVNVVNPNIKEVKP